MKWKPLFEEALKKVLNGSWDIGDVVETLKLWESLAEDSDCDFEDIEKAFLAYQRSDDGEDELEILVRVCSKIFHQ